MIYTDGVLKDSDTDSTTATLANSLSLYVGDRDGTDNGDEFNGDIDEVKVYRYALTADEVKLDYNRGSAMVLGTLSDNTSYEKGAANQQYCIPGDSTSCAAPVGRWDFEEGTGGSVNDSSGNGNTGTWNGTGTQHWIQGKVGKAGKFNGSDDYVDMGGNSVLKPTEAITFEIWFKPQAYPTVDYWKWRLISNVVASYKGYNFQFSSSTGNTGMIEALFGNGTNSWQSMDVGIVPLNEWSHLAATYTANGKGYVYLNGVQTASTDVGVLDPGVGNLQLSGQYYLVKGFMDQVRVFNYARTPAQIAYDYNRGAPVGHWKLDECQGATAYDSSGNSNNGTITIGASGEDTVGTCTTSSTAWGSGATGKRNASLNFDGTDDYVSISASSLGLVGTGNFSVSSWVNANTLGAGFNRRILAYSQDTDNGYTLLHDLDIGGRFAIEVKKSGNIYTAGATSPITSTGTWYHLVGVFNGSANTADLYVNGVRYTGGTTLGLSIPTTTNTLYIGTRDTTAHWNGQIDDVRIYNYALTATQVKQVMNEGAVRFGPSTGAP